MQLYDIKYSNPIQIFFFRDETLTDSISSSQSGSGRNGNEE